MPNVDRPALAGAQLPKPEYVLTSIMGNFISFRARGFNHKKGDGLYTADQMREFALAALAALSGPTEGSEPVAVDVICNLRTAWLELGLLLVEADARDKAVANKAREAIYTAIQALEATPAAAPEGSEPVANHPIFAFLDGSAAFEGVWFGDKNPTRKGAFWWRSVLREALATPAAASQDAKDAVMAALQKCEDVAIESGAYESYKAVGKAFDELRAAIASMAGQGGDPK